MKKNSLVRVLGFFFLGIFTFGLVFSVAPSCEARHRSYNVWHELRENAKRDSVRFIRQIWREYQNDYIQQIRDQNRWRREERREAYRAQRDAYRGNSRYNTPQCVYYITAGDTVLGTLETSRPLDEHQEAILQLVADHIKSGTPISTIGMSYQDRSRIKKYCREMGIPLRITNTAYYFA